ncbi:MAG: M24 family metallopeptidase, partial [Bacteroidota bacterium]
IGYDATRVSVTQLQHWKAATPRVRWKPAGSFLASIAAVKDASEVRNIREAIAITERVLQSVLKLLRPGVTETDVAAEISYQLRLEGGEGDAFEPIVASGERSALPHARPTRKIIASGDLVTLDFGCRFRGYHSDLTRTVAVGSVSPEKKKIYNTVLDAQTAALEAARGGMKARTLDRAARRIIQKAGYGKFFPHSLGHGLGLEVHEPPKIAARSDEILAVGNVVTIEPGIYVPGVGGVRIEDDVVLRKDDCEILTTASRMLTIL